MAQRLRVLGLLTAVVLGLHACMGRGLGQRMEALRGEAQLPPRMNAVYMQTLQVSAPPPAATPPPAPPAAPAAPAPRRAAPTAPPAVAPAASTPEAVPEPTPPTNPEPTPLPEPEPAPTDSAPPSPAPLPEPAASAVATSSFDWPTSTRVRYRMLGQYRGEVHGKAQVEWVRSGDRYQVFMDVSSGILFERHMRSEGLITPEGLAPQRYDQETLTLFQNPRRFKMLFEADGVTLANGQRAATLPGVQDTASQFVQLTYLFRRHPELLKPGAQIEIPLALPGHVSRWIYEVMQPEVIDTPMGPLETFQLKPRRAVTKANDLKAEIWFAPTLQYLPVRIRIVLDENTFLDLLLSDAPEGGKVQ